MAPALARRLGARGPGAERALAQVASQSASAAKAAAGGGGGSAERPTKVARTASGLGTAEKGEAPAPEDVPPAEEATTRALRIDGFVRPFHERQVNAWVKVDGRAGLCAARRRLHLPAPA